MSQLAQLWAAYARDKRPANIGDRVAGIPLAELDDEVQDIVGSYIGMRPDVGTWRVARLGIALAEITRLLPEIQPAETQAYFRRLALLARETLAAIVASET